MLQASKLSKSYDCKSVFSDFDLSLSRGECIYLEGPSGSGKTTLLRLLTLLESPDRGSVSLDGMSYKATALNRADAWRNSMEFRSKVTLVFQQLFLWPHMTLRKSLELVTDDATLIQSLSQELGIIEILNRYPNQVSLGQRQRVALIRAIATRPQFLLLDEITSALDEKVIDTIDGILRRLIYDGVGVLLISHNRIFAERLAQRTIKLGAKR